MTEPWPACPNGRTLWQHTARQGYCALKLANNLGNRYGRGRRGWASPGPSIPAPTYSTPCWQLTAETRGSTGRYGLRVWWQILDCCLLEFSFAPAIGRPNKTVRFFLSGYLQVPWGKHFPASYRGNHTTKVGAPPYRTVMPFVTTRDPVSMYKLEQCITYFKLWTLSHFLIMLQYTWMQSQCSTYSWVLDGSRSRIQ